MMTNSTARVRLLRNVWVNGRPHLAGDVVTATLEDALALTESMAGTFLDDDDRARCLQARREAIAKMVGRGSPFLQPGAEGAWQRMH